MLFNEAKKTLDFDNCFKIGKIYKPHGTKGQINCNFYIDLEKIKKESVFVEINKSLIPFFIDYNQSSFNENNAIVKFFDIDDIDATKIFSNNNVFIYKFDVEPIEEYLTDFENFVVGYVLFDENENEIGEILEFIDDRKNPLFVVEYKSEDVLIPVFSIEILEANFMNQKITAKIPESLLNL